MLNFLSKISNWKFIIPVLLFYLFFAAYLLPNYQQQMNQIAGEEVQILDLQRGYTLVQVNEFFTKLKPEGRAIYRHVTSFVDMIYPFVYGILLILVLAFFLKNLFGNGSKWLFLAWTPILIMIFDFLENTNTLALLDAFPNLSNEMVERGSNFTSWKWIWVMFVFGLIILGGIGYLWKSILNKKKEIKT